jgi:hypothetical protein
MKHDNDTGNNYNYMIYLVHVTWQMASVVDVLCLAWINLQSENMELPMMFPCCAGYCLCMSIQIVNTKTHYRFTALTLTVTYSSQVTGPESAAYSYHMLPICSTNDRNLRRTQAPRVAILNITPKTRREN